MELERQEKFDLDASSNRNTLREKIYTYLVKQGTQMISWDNRINSDASEGDIVQIPAKELDLPKGHMKNITLIVVEKITHTINPEYNIADKNMS